MARSARPPFVIVWRTTESCNLACPFCAYDKRLPYPRRRADADEIRRMVALFADWQAMTGRPVLMSWLGGEPTLWPDLEEISALTAARGLAQSLTTNGTTLGSPAMRRLLLERFDEITISIDGFTEFHDAMRGWKGAFAKLRTTVRALHLERARTASRTALRANVVLMRGNVEAFPDLCLELARWGIRHITFNQLGGRDRPEFHPANRLRPEQVEDLKARLHDIRAELAGQGVTLLANDLYVARISETSSDIARPVHRCDVARDFWFIDEEGTVAPCNFVGRHFGITTTHLRSVRDLERLGATLCETQRTSPSVACENCMSTQQFAKFSMD